MQTILLVDDHALFRCGLKMVLEAGLPGIDVIEAGSLEDAMKMEGDAPSLLLLDVQLHGLNGIEGMSLLRRKWGNTPIAMVSADDADHTVEEAMRRGAAAFLSKADSGEHIRRAVAGLLGLNASTDTPPAVPAATAGQTKAPLTPRQCEVLDLLSQGLPNKLIGRRLNLSENTVRGHVQAILQALQVDNRSEAAFAARRRGLIR